MKALDYQRPQVEKCMFSINIGIRARLIEERREGGMRISQKREERKREVVPLAVVVFHFLWGREIRIQSLWIELDLVKLNKSLVIEEGRSWKTVPSVTCPLLTTQSISLILSSFLFLCYTLSHSSSSPPINSNHLIQHCNILLSHSFITNDASLL